jgi:hypothetical protein
MGPDFPVDKASWFVEQWALLNRAGRRKYKNKIELFVKAYS